MSDAVPIEDVSKLAADIREVRALLKAQRPIWAIEDAALAAKVPQKAPLKIEPDRLASWLTALTLSLAPSRAPFTRPDPCIGR